ncbi:MAG: DUF4922 domain-containing protein [Bacteroidales bacterium]|nr:DUF4922 domain-containing protein [Bacteroidales bacterium]
MTEKIPTIEKFFRDQLSVWPLASTNYRSIKGAKRRTMEIGGLKVVLQHNPVRILSTAAQVDDAAIKGRPCFLCEENRPGEQNFLKFEGRKGKEYQIVVNPYPIFGRHLVVIRDEHTGQSIWNNYVDMADLAHHYPGYTFFYNGPKCGASAPDHFHFQACQRGILPLEKEADRLLDMVAALPSDSGFPDGTERVTLLPEMVKDLSYVDSVQEAQLYHYKHFARGVFFLRSRTSKSMAKMFYRLLDAFPAEEGESEPKFNLFTWYKGEGKRPEGNTHGLASFEYRAIVVLRSAHRSHHFFSEGEDHLTMSPGCADMAGFFVCPVKEDFDKLTPALLEELLSEVTVSPETEKTVLWRLTRTQPTLQVGIMSGQEIEFEIISDGAGPQKVSYREGKIDYNGVLYDTLLFDAQTASTIFAEPTFILYGVTIGIDFHWERKLTQKFAGSLKFIVEGGKVQAVNIIGVEDYLLSVISSEMKASATMEYLCTHAVISRSWVMSQINGRKNRSPKISPEDVKELSSMPYMITNLVQGGSSAVQLEASSHEYVKWFDHDDHKNFDVCADDHCQRYQGLSMAVGENVRKAIDRTWGEVLTYGGEICDCRFYKCCGGKTEIFSTCWEDKDYPYLPSLPDTPDHDPEGHCFCDTHDEAILSQVLNDYDLETKDFFHWKTEYTREEISDLIHKRSGIDFGTILELVPLEYGPSGRIKKLKVKGTLREMVIGKELIIRRWLSDSHLKSSAFTITWTDDDRLILDGYGWGHGVGLCQIGAAVMAYSGYSYGDILQHYYPGATLERMNFENN